MIVREIAPHFTFDSYLVRSARKFEGGLTASTFTNYRYREGMVENAKIVPQYLIDWVASNRYWVVRCYALFMKQNQILQKHDVALKLFT